MSRPEINIPTSRTWRDIPQQVQPRLTSAESRRRAVRRWLGRTAAAAVIAGIAWGALEVAGSLEAGPKKLASGGQTVPVKETVLITDGVLDQKWLVRTLDLPKGATLMELDLHRLEKRLLASGQVHAATLTRTFPATLTVRLSEHSPVARVMVQSGLEKRLLLVARDGTLFEGAGYAKELVESLPWLDGVKLARHGGSFDRIGRMEPVADLLAKAKLEAEHLYRTWRVVSLARLVSDGEIEVQSDDVQKIVFGTREDFFRQLARLDRVLEITREKTNAPVRSINLAIGAQVPLAFASEAVAAGPKNVAVAARNPAPSAEPKKLVLPAFPILQRNLNEAAGDPPRPQIRL